MEDPWSITLQTVLIVLALIILSGVFSLFYSALAACRKPRLQKEIGGGNLKAQKTLKAAENPHSWLVTVRFWISVFRVSAVFFAGIIVTRYAGALEAADFSADGTAISIADSVAVFLAAAAVLIIAAFLLGDLIPGIIGRMAPERIAAALLPVISIFSLPVRPFNFLAGRMGAFLYAALGLEKRNHNMTEDELRLALMEGEKSGIVESKERTMVEGVFYLGDRPVGAFMTHRSEIQWLDVNASADEIHAKILECRSQRCFPVADGNLDEIIGAVYLEDIILAVHSSVNNQAVNNSASVLEWTSPQGLRGVMKKAQFVPETMSALKAFEAFKRGEANFLFVMDEYGGFTGILSIRDLIEEIVGELAAPSHEVEPIIQQEDGLWLADGNVSIDEAAKSFGLPALAAEHSDYHTLAGFVLSLAGELPHPGDSFSAQGFRFQVTGMDGNRIDKLLVSREKT